MSSSHPRSVLVISHQQSQIICPRAPCLVPAWTASWRIQGHRGSFRDSALHSAICRVHTAHCTLHTSHCTLQTALHTSNSNCLQGRGIPSCPAGHPLKLAYRQPRWNCDLCRVTTSNSASWRCDFDKRVVGVRGSCDYDICKRCLPEQVSEDWNN